MVDRDVAVDVLEADVALVSAEQRFTGMARSGWPGIFSVGGEAGGAADRCAAAKSPARRASRRRRIVRCILRALEAGQVLVALASADRAPGAVLDEDLGGARPRKL